MWQRWRPRAPRLCAPRGATVMHLAVDGNLAGILAVSHPVKATTAEALTSLRKAGIRLVMATADGLTTARAVALRSIPTATALSLATEANMKQKLTLRLRLHRLHRARYSAHRRAALPAALPVHRLATVADDPCAGDESEFAFGDRQFLAPTRRRHRCDVNGSRPFRVASAARSSAQWRGWLNVVTDEAGAGEACEGDNPMHPATGPHLLEPFNCVESIDTVGAGRSQVPALGGDCEFAGQPDSGETTLGRLVAEMPSKPCRQT